jgi:hypothetical protein
MSVTYLLVRNWIFDWIRLMISGVRAHEVVTPPRVHPHPHTLSLIPSVSLTSIHPPLSPRSTSTLCRRRRPNGRRLAPCPSLDLHPTPPLRRPAPSLSLELRRPWGPRCGALRRRRHSPTPDPRASRSRRSLLTGSTLPGGGGMPLARGRSRAPGAPSWPNFSSPTARRSSRWRAVRSSAFLPLLDARDGKLARGQTVLQAPLTGGASAMLPWARLHLRLTRRHASTSRCASSPSSPSPPRCIPFTAPSQLTPFLLVFARVQALQEVARFRFEDGFLDLTGGCSSA